MASLVEAGTLPVFQQLFDNGVRFVLQGHPPLGSPSSEVTLLTGRAAHEHGMFTCLTDPSETEPPKLTPTPTLPASVWERLESVEKTCLSVGWPVFPPAAGGGVHENLFLAASKGRVPDTVSDELSGLCLYPEEVGEDLLSVLAPNISSHPASGRFRLALQLAIGDLFSRHSVTTALLGSSTNWDAAFIHYPFLDTLSEAFLPFEDPPLHGGSPDEQRAYAQVIRNAYVLLDHCLARIRECMGTECTLILCSGYGLSSSAKRPHRLSSNPVEHEAWLQADGVFLAEGPCFRRGQVLPSQSILGVQDLVLTLLSHHEADLPQTWSGLFQDQPVKGGGNRHPLPEASPVSVSLPASETLRSLETEFNLYGQIAQSQKASGELYQAIDTYSALLERFPEADHARLERINLLHKLGRLDEILVELETWNPCRLDQLHVKLLQAETHYELGDYEAAFHILDTHSLLVSDNPDLLSRKGLAQAKMTQFSQAKDTFEQALRIEPDHGYSLLGLGLISFLRGRPDEAFVYVQRGLNTANNFYLGWSLLGEILLQLDRPQEALEAIQQAIALDPPFPAKLFHLAADICENTAQLEPMKHHYRKAAHEFSIREWNVKAQRNTT